ncbi:MAG: hypothetical protein NT116_03810, partial [Candidatus Parcubacteria bacterium]|nr:hypothetical protein [Candidatus Parcubacteria bacterium]
MQLYEIKTSVKGKKGKHKKIFTIGPSTAGLMKESGYNGFRILKVNTNVPTMCMADIARRLRITVEETINFFRGLNGKPN